MADHAQPVVTTNYVDVLDILKSRIVDLALGLDPATTSPTNLATNTVRWNGASNKWQKWNGTTWVDLSSAYAINISGVAATATALATVRTINGVNFNGTANITLPTVNDTGNQNIAGIKTFSSPIAGSVTGNAATVTNGVYTIGAQSIDGVKTFTSQIVGSISGVSGGVASGGSLHSTVVGTTAAEKTATTVIATMAAVDRLRSLASSTTTGTLVIDDRGAWIPITANMTVPNAVFSTRDVVTLYNNTAGNLTVVQGASFTLRLVGTGSTGNRTLAARGQVTITFISGSEAVISGGGLS